MVALPNLYLLHRCSIKVDRPELLRTRRERLKSALYLRLKKRKTFFWKKTFFRSFRKFFFFRKMSHSAEKCKRGDPLGFINIFSVAKYQDSFETLKIFEKKSHNAEKRKGDPLVSSGFVGYVKKRGDRLH